MGNEQQDFSKLIDEVSRFIPEDADKAEGLYLIAVVQPDAKGYTTNTAKIIYNISRSAIWLLKKEVIENNNSDVSSIQNNLNALGEKDVPPIININTKKLDEKLVHYLINLTNLLSTIRQQELTKKLVKEVSPFIPSEEKCDENELYSYASLKPGEKKYTSNTAKIIHNIAILAPHLLKNEGVIEDAKNATRILSNLRALGEKNVPCIIDEDTKKLSETLFNYFINLLKEKTLNPILQNGISTGLQHIRNNSADYFLKILEKASTKKLDNGDALNKEIQDFVRQFKEASSNLNNKLNNKIKNLVKNLKKSWTSLGHNKEIQSFVEKERKEEKLSDDEFLLSKNTEIFQSFVKKLVKEELSDDALNEKTQSFIKKLAGNDALNKKIQGLLEKFENQLSNNEEWDNPAKDAIFLHTVCHIIQNILQPGDASNIQIDYANLIALIQQPTNIDFSTRFLDVLKNLKDPTNTDISSFLPALKDCINTFKRKMNDLLFSLYEPFFFLFADDKTKLAEFTKNCCDIDKMLAEGRDKTFAQHLIDNLNKILQVIGKNKNLEELKVSNQVNHTGKELDSINIKLATMLVGSSAAAVDSSDKATATTANVAAADDNDDLLDFKKDDEDITEDKAQGQSGHISRPSMSIAAPTIITGDMTSSDSDREESGSSTPVFTASTKVSTDANDDVLDLNAAITHMGTLKPEKLAILDAALNQQPSTNIDKLDGTSREILKKVQSATNMKASEEDTEVESLTKSASTRSSSRTSSSTPTSQESWHSAINRAKSDSNGSTRAQSGSNSSMDMKSTENKMTVSPTLASSQPRPGSPKSTNSNGSSTKSDEYNKQMLLKEITHLKQIHIHKAGEARTTAQQNQKISLSALRGTIREILYKSDNYFRRSWWQKLLGLGRHNALLSEQLEKPLKTLINKLDTALEIDEDYYEKVYKDSIFNQINNIITILKHLSDSGILEGKKYHLFKNIREFGKDFISEIDDISTSVAILKKLGAVTNKIQEEPQFQFNSDDVRKETGNKTDVKNSSPKDIFRGDWFKLSSSPEQQSSSSIKPTENRSSKEQNAARSETFLLAALRRNFG